MFGKILLWLGTFILAILFLLQIFFSSKTFLEGPTFFTSSFLDQKDATVPDISFCFTPKVRLSISRYFELKLVFYL